MTAKRTGPSFRDLQTTAKEINTFLMGDKIPTSKVAGDVLGSTIKDALGVLDPKKDSLTKGTILTLTGLGVDMEKFQVKADGEVKKQKVKSDGQKVAEELNTLLKLTDPIDTTNFKKINEEIIDVCGDIQDGEFPRSAFSDLTLKVFKALDIKLVWAKKAPAKKKAAEPKKVEAKVKKEEVKKEEVKKEEVKKEEVKKEEVKKAEPKKKKGPAPKKAYEFKQYEVHKYATMIPAMNEEQFKELVLDIQENTQLQPILTFEDVIIDGRSRYEACKVLNIMPLTTPWDGKEEDLLTSIISWNIKRRPSDSWTESLIGCGTAP